MARIVAIDDMDGMRMLYEDLLTSWGHETLVFDDGAPALSTVDFSEVDLVLTDLQMSTSGQLVIRTIRAWGHDVPIVVVSGTVGPDDFDGLKRMGAQEIMSKPPDFRALRQTIEDLVTQARTSRPEGERDMLRRRSHVQRMLLRSALMAGIMISAGLMFPPETVVWVHFLLFVILFLVLRPI